jgi:hypothetical protein
MLSQPIRSVRGWFLAGQETNVGRNPQQVRTQRQHERDVGADQQRTAHEVAQCLQSLPCGTSTRPFDTRQGSNGTALRLHVGFHEWPPCQACQPWQTR